MKQELLRTVQQMAQPGKGILAADESHKTIKKRFDTIGVESTEETRRSYRNMLFTAEGLHEFISGVILFEETLGQSTDNGVLFPQYLEQQGIVPGIKVDKGLIPLVNSADEKITQGLDGLPERLAQYKSMGARFAKWRAVYDIDALRPSPLAIATNAENLARYAAICQSQGIVPIVEPELLMDGEHDLQRCAEMSRIVFHEVFNALYRHGVDLELIMLKPSMVISGSQCPAQASVEKVAEATVKILMQTVPAAVPTINFLSGGQSAQLATQHLQSMHEQFPTMPWNLSFSYGRALQEPALATWAGKADNIPAAQAALLQRASLNGAAAEGKYTGE